MTKDFIETKWMGHATWELKTSSGKTLVIDPWYTENPVNPGQAEHVKADYVLISHDHWDHVKDVLVFVQHGAKVVTLPEVENRFVEERELPQDAFIRANLGGTVPLDDDIKVTLFQAFHSADSGVPCGLIIQFRDITIMDVGDTALHKDMELYGELYPPTLLFVPIGDRFTMGIREAALAVKMIKPKFVVPKHYNTFPAIEQDPKAFAEEVAKVAPDVEVWLPEPGDKRVWENIG